MIKTVAGFLKSGCGRCCTLIVGNYFSHNLRISPVGYKIKKENHNLHIFNPFDAVDALKRSADHTRFSDLKKKTIQYSVSFFSQCVTMTLLYL